MNVNISARIAKKNQEFATFSVNVSDTQKGRRKEATCPLPPT
jgi:hypothetical protein